MFLKSLRLLASSFVITWHYKIEIKCNVLNIYSILFSTNKINGKCVKHYKDRKTSI